MNLLNVPKK